MFNLIPVRRERDPLAPTLQGLRGDVDRLFSNLFGEDGAFAGAPWPACEVVETKENLVLRAEVPGMDPKDFEVRVDGDILTISGETKQEKDMEEDGLHLSERRYGQWRRSFRLPAYADPDRVEAEVKNGVLTLTVAKREEAKPKIVRIKAS
ncbi:MAG TPA: Hsp20/alpha crystallin family protein [Planctomycetota bacterium]|nr:Hsp20/alpha crystallin family protein [Planctomycetota bacterium]